MESVSAREIRALRQALSLTQEEFAHQLGITVATVNRWENGHNAPTRLAAKALRELRAQLPSPSSKVARLA